jgi:hypothetical protein
MLHYIQQRTACLYAFLCCIVSGLMLPACSAPYIDLPQPIPNASATRPAVTNAGPREVAQPSPAGPVSQDLPNFNPDTEFGPCATWIHFTGSFKNDTWEGRQDEYWVKKDNTPGVDGQWEIAAFQHESTALGRGAENFFSVFLPQKMSSQVPGYTCHFAKVGPASDRNLCRLSDSSRATYMFVRNGQAFQSQKIAGKPTAKLATEGSDVVLTYLGRRGAMGYGKLTGLLVSNACR